MNKRTLLGGAIVGFLICSVGAGIAFADFATTNWQFKKEVRVSSGSEGYVAIPVDSDLFKANKDLSDIRVIDSTGHETPYQLVIKDDGVGQDYYGGTVRDVSQTMNGSLTFVVDVGTAGVIHDRINIHTGSAKNFRRQVSVYASDTRLSSDSDGWRLLTKSGYIYHVDDDEANFFAGSGVVTYPQSTARYLRVVIHAGEGVLNTVSADVYRFVHTTAEENSITADVIISQNAKEKSTELLTDVGASLPVRGISLSTRNKNFNRRVVVQGSADGKNWRLIGQGYIFSVDTKLFTGSEFSVTFPETSTRFVRTIVFNEDNDPLLFDSRIKVASVARLIVFLSEAGRTYEVFYGNQKAQHPQYDLARLFKYVESGDIARGILSAEERNTSYVPPAPPVIPFTERYPNALNVALVCLVAVIAVFLFFYTKKLARPQV